MEKPPYSKLAITSFILGLWPFLAITVSFKYLQYLRYHPISESNLTFGNLGYLLLVVMTWALFLSPFVVVTALVLAIISGKRNKQRQTQGEIKLKGVKLAWVGVILGIIGCIFVTALLWLGGLGAAGG